MEKKNRVKDVNRINIFYDENSYNLDVEYGRAYVEQDVHTHITLYRIDVIQSRVDDLYGEALPSDKKYFPPIQLTAQIESLDQDEQEYRGNSGIVRQDTGNLIFSVFLKELEEKDTDINRGDIVSYYTGKKERFYEVANADYTYDNTEKSMLGYKPYIRTIEATPIKSDVINNFLDNY
ncbi:MAG: hypothetical protein ACOC33_03695 [bacterium]